MLLGIARVVFGLCGLLTLWLRFAAPATADVGPTGAFHTTVAIKVPPFHGLEPRLGLAYSSPAPNGWVGVGWSLTGLSAIRRESAKLGLPRWDTADMFTLDGQRLLACPPPTTRPPDPGSLAASPSCAHQLDSPEHSIRAYTTRVESFQRIAVQGDPFDTDPLHRPNGGGRWLVWRTDGVKATYEPGLVTSRGVLEWRLARTEDRSGNSVSFDWTEPQSAQVSVLKAIRYADVEIRFQTERRPDPVMVATGDGLVENATRLQVVDELVGGRQRIRAYALRYRPDDPARPSRQSFLASVQQYGSDATVSGAGVDGKTKLPPITFTPPPQPTAAEQWAPRQPVNVADWAAGWVAGPDDAAGWRTTLDGPGGEWWPDARKETGSWLTVDLNGDRRTDFVLIQPFVYEIPETSLHYYAFDVKVEFTKPDGGYHGLLQRIQWPEKLTRDAYYIPLVGDVNADGISDLSLAFGHAMTTLFGRDILPGGGELPTSGLQILPDNDKLLLGDVTGDGLADLVDLYLTPSNSACGVALKVGVGDGSGQFTAPFPSRGETCWGSLLKGTKFNPFLQDLQLADLNGDLKADVVAFQRASDDPKDNLPNAKIFTGVSKGADLNGAVFFDTHEQPAPPWAETTKISFIACRDVRRCERNAKTQVPASWSDVDGEGRSDLVVFRPSGDGNIHAWTALSKGNGFFSPFQEGTTPFPNDALLDIVDFDPLPNDQVRNKRPPGRWLQGDFNGDAIPDMGVLTTNYQPVKPKDAHPPNETKQTVLRAVADRRGNWTALPVTTQDWLGECTRCWYPPMLAATGDINADGRDDVMFAHENATADPNTRWTQLDVDLSGTIPVAAQVLLGDVNADGRQDLLYPTMTPGGVQVHVLQQRADHTYQHLDPVTVPTGPHRAQDGWLVADVNCDRLADLLNLDRDVIVLLAGSDQAWQLAIQAPMSVPPGGRWSAADVNGDGCDDLVRVGWRDSAKAAGVLTLLGAPSGILQQEWMPSNLIPGLTVGQPFGWQPVSIDGDRDTDLVSVDSRSGGIQTLLRRAGAWQRVPDLVAAGFNPPLSDANGAGHGDFILSTGSDPAWRALDVNGDGANDLVRVSVDSTNRLLVESLLSHGDGHFSPHTSVVRPDSDAPEMGPDVQYWSPADIDHDGRGDLVRVVDHNGDEGQAIQAVLSKGTSGWTMMSWWNAGERRLPASSAWRVGDLDGAGHASALQLLASGNALTVSGFDGLIPYDRITATRNGLGATTTVDYQAATSMQPSDRTLPDTCRLSAGTFAIPVVAKLTTRDAPTDTADASTIRYACPHYSPELRSLVAWQETWTHHHATVNRPASREHVVRDVFDSGIVQPVLEVLSDRQGPLRITHSRYKQPLEQPQTGLPQVDQPQTNLLEEKAVSDCAPRKPVSPPQLDAHRALVECATSTITLTHDDFGNITSQLDQAGSGRQRRTETFYLHDHAQWLQALPRLSRTVDPAHPDRLLRAALTCYDNDASPNCDHLPAKARGLATLIRRWNDTGRTLVETSRASFDQFGNQTSVTDGNRHKTTITFDPQLHLHPIRMCNARQQCTQQPEPWDRRADAPLQVTDANGAITRHTYDPLGRPETTTRPTGAVDTYSYSTDETAGNVAIDTTTAPGVRLWTRTFSDGLDRIYLVEQPSRDPQRIVQMAIHFSDTSTRPYKTALPAFEGEDPVWETMRYDAVGRLIYRSHGDRHHSAISRRYFIRNGLTGVRDHDETGRTQTHLYDGWGALVVTEQPSVTPGHQLATTHYSYNAVGELTAITDPAGNTIRNEYDTLGRKTAEHDPDRGTTHYRYDLAGNLKRQRDARGRVLVYDYDELNRRIRKHDLTSTAASNWTYDERGHGASVGRLTSIHDPSAAGCPQKTSRSLAYDASGNITRETRCIRGARLIFTSHYDPLGRLDTLTYPDREQLTYTYDQAGRLNTISGYVKAMRYNAVGQLISARYANGTRARWDYNRSRGWLDTQTLVDPVGHSLFDTHYDRDPSGLIRRAYSTSNHTDERYGYDALGRLTSVTGTWQQQLRYDDLGNIISNTSVGLYRYPQRRHCRGRQGSKRACAGPHAATDADDVSYQYDAAGNMTAVTTHPAPTAVSRYSVKAKQSGRRRDTLWAIAADHLGDPRRWPELFALNKGHPYPKPPGGRFTDPNRIFPGQRLLIPAASSSPRPTRTTVRTLTWNTDGQLAKINDKRVGWIVNLYDANGARVQQTGRDGTTRFFGRLANWTPKTGLTKYIYAGSMLVARHQGPKRLWYTLDRLGSPRLLIDQGRHPRRLDFAPYGQTISRQDSIGYTGHHTIGQTDLIDMLARAYDPNLARMLSADTLIPDLSNPQALNRYSYAYNNPIAFTDPSGHLPIQNPISLPGDAPQDLIEFLERSDRFAEMGVTGLQGVTFHPPRIDALGPTHEEIERDWLNPKLRDATGTASAAEPSGTASDVGVGGSASSGSDTGGTPQAGTTQAPPPGDQIPHTGCQKCHLLDKTLEGPTLNAQTSSEPSNATAGPAPVIENIKARREAIMGNLPARFIVHENPGVEANPFPWYFWPFASRVNQYADLLDAAARRNGLDPDLLKAVAFLEDTHGYYDIIKPNNQSIRPMNVYASLWKDLGISRKDLADPRINIEVGAYILAQIYRRTVDPTPEKVFTLYNSLGATQVSRYGRTAARYYELKPWESWPEHIPHD